MNASTDDNKIVWVSTTQDQVWQQLEPPTLSPVAAMPDVIPRVNAPTQTIDGFGACFNELGWTSLLQLSEEERAGIFAELFASGIGANLTICRMPIGANDFSRDWYSYDEVVDDFTLEHFTIENDLETLVPFIQNAQAAQPELRLWASPWSPPTWMKRNGHYAGALTYSSPGAVDNGLLPDKVGKEGTDMFILEDAYLATYADYFGRFIDSYKDLGINIEMVMPQNEFNSPQVFPSCTWTPSGLIAFLRHLGPQMKSRDVQIFLGTLERADDDLIGEVLRNPDVGSLVSGVGVQWEGKKALAALHRLYPELPIYQTEQECGNGKNDWRQARSAWSLMKHFISNGANAYTYWNISLLEGGVSRWGWEQNSLIVVDPETRTFRFTYEYQVLKHVSAYVQPGATFIDSWSTAGYDNQLIFENPDGSTVVVIQNDLCEDLPINIMVQGQMLSPTLPADSLNTFVIPAAS